MKRKLLIYCPSFFPEQTGYAHAFSGLIKNLLESDFVIDVLTPQLNSNTKEFYYHPNLRVIRFNPVLKIWMLGLFYRFYKLARFVSKLDEENKYDAVFIETGDEPLLIALLNESLLHKVVVRFHSTSDTEYLFLGHHFKYKLRLFFWRFMASKRLINICATNPYHLNFACNKIIEHKNFNYCDVIINTIDETKLIEEIRPDTRKGKVFFMLGRMDHEGYKQKGFDVLLKALPIVENHFINTDSKIVVVGDGNYHELFKEAVVKYSFITLHKSLPHNAVIDVLSQSDVVLLPSLYEGASMFALEALESGKAIVFSNTGGLIDMVDGNGVLVEPGDYKNLASAIIEIIQHTDINELKKKSIKIAKENFGEAKQVAQFQHMIEVLKK